MDEPESSCCAVVVFTGPSINRHHGNLLTYWRADDDLVGLSVPCPFLRVILPRESVDRGGMG